MPTAVFAGRGHLCLRKLDLWRATTVQAIVVDQIEKIGEQFQVSAAAEGRSAVQELQIAGPRATDQTSDPPGDS